MATATTPAPLPASESDDQTRNSGSGMIPGDRPEFPLPTLDDKHHFLTAPGSIERPRTPPELSFEDSRALLTRLTGLQPWQLEAFPDELPPLPVSRPSSPLLSPETGRPSTTPIARRLSSTSVPIRFRKPHSSPVAQRDAAIESVEPAPSPGTSPGRPRHAKAQSAEFKSSREFRPLYLLERNRKSQEVDEVLPALPQSGSPSRVSSSTETEGEYESALESPGLGASLTPDDPFFEPPHIVSDFISSRPGPELQHPELADREIEEVDESGQVTPKPSDYAGGTSGPAHDALAAALEDAKTQATKDSRTELQSLLVSPNRATPLAPSAPLDDTMMRDVPSAQSREASPSTSSRLQTAALGAAIGGLTAAALRDRSPSPPLVGKGKGKGKSKKKAKGKQDSISESLLPAPTEETSTSEKIIPTFVDNEDDWAKNKSESIVTDDATLVGEPAAGSSTSKELRREKVLESTAPVVGEATQVERAVLNDVKSTEEPVQESLKTLDEPSAPPKTEITLADEYENLERALPEQPSDTINESIESPTPKSKKSKKNKKGKRGSQQLEHELSTVSEQLVPADQILPAPESQQKTVEREILGPAFADEIEEENVGESAPVISREAITGLESGEAQRVVPESEEAQQVVPESEEAQQVVPESFVAVEEAKESLSEPVEEATEYLSEPVETVTAPTEPSAAVVEGSPIVEEPQPYREAKVVEEPKVAAKSSDLAKETPVTPATPEAKSAKPGWGTGFLGALGWGKKKAPPPPKVPKEKPITPMVEGTAEVTVPPATVVPTQSREIASVSQDTEQSAAQPLGVLEALKQKRAMGQAEPTAAPFVVPKTAYFADNGKPAFEFPVLPTTSRDEDTVQAPITEDVGETEVQPMASVSQPESSEDIASEAQPTYRAVMPQTSYFADDGKPHFTYPSFTTKSDNQPTADIAQEVPTQQDEKRSSFVVPTTSFFGDDGRPHFSYPSFATASDEQVAAVEVGQDGSMQQEEKRPVFVTPTTTFFGDGGRPHFSYPSFATESDKQVAAVQVDQDVPTQPEQTRSSFVAPTTTFFGDDGRPHFSYPITTESVENRLEDAPVDSLPVVEMNQQDPASKLSSQRELPGDESAPVEPSSIKKKKSKKDKKKRGSIAVAEPTGTFETERPTALAPKTEQPVDVLPASRVEQRAGDLVEDAPAVDPVTGLLRGGEDAVEGLDNVVFEAPARDNEPAAEVPDNVVTEVSTQPEAASREVQPKDVPIVDDLKAPPPDTEHVLPEQVDPATEHRSEALQAPSETSKGAELTDTSMAVEDTVFSAAPIDEDVTSTSSKKKNKKAKKAKRGSVALEGGEQSAPVNERSLHLPSAGPSEVIRDVSLDVPLPVQEKGEERDLVERVPDLLQDASMDLEPTESPAHTPQPVVEDVAVESAVVAEDTRPATLDVASEATGEAIVPTQGVTEATPISTEDDLGSMSKKKKKGKKSKTKSGAQTPEVQLDPIVEPSSTTSDTLILPSEATSAPRDLDQATAPVPTDAVEPSLADARSSEPDKPLDDGAISTAATEQLATQDTPTSIEQITETEAAPSMSKKEKKKKKGKKAKEAEAQVDEPAEPRTPVVIETLAQSIRPEEIKLPDEDLVDELELPAEDTTVVPQIVSEPQDQAEMRDIAPSSEVLPEVPHAEALLEPASRDVADTTEMQMPPTEAPIDIPSGLTIGIEHQPIVDQETVQQKDTTAEDESSAPPSTKKDKKKKKGKKSNATTDAEPSTPISEASHTLESTFKPAPPVSDLSQERPNKDSLAPEAAQVEPVVALPTLPEDETAATPSQPDLNTDVSRDILPQEAPQLENPIEAEIATSSKKSKKKKGKKDKSGDVEPAPVDLVESEIKEQSAAEPSAPESKDEVVQVEMPQDVALPLETPGELDIEPSEDTPSSQVEESVIDSAREAAPSTEKDGVQKQTVQDVPQVIKDVEAPMDVSTAVPSVDTTPASAAEIIQASAPSLDQPTDSVAELNKEMPRYEEPIASAAETATRDILEAVDEDEPASASKKTKKKKTKKAKTLDIEPSTPVSEEPALPVDDAGQSAVVERTTEEVAQPSNDTTNTELASLTTDAALVLSDQVNVDPLPTQREAARDTAVSTAVETGEIEATSKKAKKKKGKKGKSSDSTEPSTPVIEESSMQFGPAQEPRDLETKTIDATIPTQEQIESETLLPSTNVEPSVGLSPAQEDERNTVLPTAEFPAQESTESAPSVEHPVAEAAEITSKKSKKNKKGKKSMPIEDDEPVMPAPAAEILPTVEAVPVVNDEPAKQAEEPVPMDTQLESTSIGHEPRPTPAEDVHADQELATEIGQLAEPLDFEMPMESPAIDNLQEIPNAPEVSEPAASQLEQPVADEEPVSSSKKAKKKKGKKDKSVSEPQIPVTEVESFIPTATGVDGDLATPIDAPITEDGGVRDDSQNVPRSMDVESTDSNIAESTAPVSSIPEPSAEPMILTEQDAGHSEAVEQIADSKLSKKDKKKAKKGKRASVVEDTLSAPSTSAAELPIELESQDSAAAVPLPKEPTFSEPVSPKTAPVELPPTESASGELALDNDSDLQQPSSVEPEQAVDALNAPDKELAPSVAEQSQSVEEEVTISKKDKKKAKKNKRSSTAENEASALVETPTQEVEQAPLDEQPEPVPELLPEAENKAVSTSVDLTPDVSRELPSEVLQEQQQQTEEVVADQPQQLQEGAEEVPLSKKDKKKAKKNKRVSIVEDVVLPATPAEEKAVAFEEPAVPAQQLPEASHDEAVSSSVDVQPITASQIVEEPSQVESNVLPNGQLRPVDSIAEDEQPIKPSVDDEPANLSKKDKKKGKKAKRVFITEPESTLATPIEEKAEPQLPVDEPLTQTTAVVEEPISEVPLVEEPVSKDIAVEDPVALPIDESTASPISAEAPAPLSKKDKKKAKKSKRGSIAEGETCTPIETPAEELGENPLDASQASGTTAVEEPALTPVDAEQSAPVEPQVAEESALLELPKPTESIVAGEEHALTEVVSHAEPTASTPTVDDLPRDVQEEAAVPVSKKDKKKAKKAKRASTVEDQPTEPATSVEEIVKELALEDQPSASVPVEEPQLQDAPFNDQAPDNPMTDKPTSTPAPAEDSNDLALSSQKDKKKAKKQQKKSELDTVPFLAHETPEAANSDTQPSPTPSIPSETSLLLSGIPTSYPHVRDSAFVEIGGEKEQEESAVVVEKDDVRDVGKESVDEKEIEQNVVAEELMAPSEAQDRVDIVEEPIETNELRENESERGDVAGTKETGNNETASEQVSTTVEAIETAPRETPAIDTAPTDSNAAQPEELAHTEPQVEATGAQSIEESKAVAEEPAVATPPSPEKKKVKKHKLAAMFEQAAAGSAPMAPPKRAPWAKSSSKTDTSGPSLERAEIPHAKEVTPVEPEPKVTADENAKVEVVQPPEVVTEPSESRAIETEVAEPLEASVKHTEVVEAQPTVPTETIEQPEELAPSLESSLPTKKDKKKSKKSKKQSGTSTPIEIIEDANATPREEPAPMPLTDPEPEAVTIERDVPVGTTDSPPTQQAQEINLEQLQDTPVIADPPSELMPTASEEQGTVLSKKEKKRKGKKSKQSADVLTPAQELESEAQSGVTDQDIIIPSDQPTAVVVPQPELVAEEQVLPQQEPPERPTVEEPIDNAQRDIQPVSVGPVSDAPQQEATVPIAMAPLEDKQPVEEEPAPTLSKKDKKKNKRAKEVLGVATPLSEDVPDIESQQIPDATSSQFDEPATERFVEPQEAQAQQPLVEDLLPVASDVGAVSTEPEEAPRTATAVAADTEDHAPIISDASIDPVKPVEAVEAVEPIEPVEPVKPTEEDWAFTPPKKDKKKSKKGKTSSIVAPTAETVSEVPTEEASALPRAVEAPKSHDTALDQASEDVLKATSFVEATSATTDNMYEIPSDRALDATATSIAQDTPLATSSLESGPSLQEDVSSTLSKKDKKKAKKSKKASGSATPVTELISIAELEPTAESAVMEAPIHAESIKLDDAPLGLDIRALDLVDAPVVHVSEPETLADASTKNEQFDVALPDVEEVTLPDSIPEADSLPAEKSFVSEDTFVTRSEKAVPAEQIHSGKSAALDAASNTDSVPQEAPEISFISKKSKKTKGKKSDAAIPIVTKAAEAPLGVVTDVHDATAIDKLETRPSIVEDQVTHEVSHDTQHPQVATTFAGTEPQSTADELPTQTSSKRSKKKGKKSGIATPVDEELPAIPPEEVLPPVVENTVVQNEVFIPEEPVVEEPVQTNDFTPKTAPLLLEQDTKVVLQDQLQQTPQEPALTNETLGFDVTTLSSEDKTSDRSLQSSMPVAEPSAIADPDVHTSTRDLPQTLSSQFDSQVQALEPSAIAQTLPSETTKELDTEEKPILGRKLSKKEKKAQKKAGITTFDDEAVTEKDASILPTLEPALTSNLVEDRPKQLIVDKLDAPDSSLVSDLPLTDREAPALRLESTATAIVDDTWQEAARDGEEVAPPKEGKTKKDKKGKRQTAALVTAEDVQDKPIDSLEQDPTDARPSQPIVSETLVEGPGEAAQLQTPASPKDGMEESRPEPTSIDLPAYEAKDETFAQLAETEHVSGQPAPAPIVERAIELPPPSEVNQDGAEDEWAFTPSTKKSKKEKKSKKSKSTAGIATPAEVTTEPKILPRETTSDNATLASSQELPRETISEETQMTVPELLFSTPAPPEMQSTSLMNTSQDDDTSPQAHEEELQERTIDVDISEPALSRSTSKKSKKKKDKKGQKESEDLLNDISAHPAVVGKETTTATPQPAALEQDNNAPTITAATEDATRSPSPFAFKTPKTNEVPQVKNAQSEVIPRETMEPSLNLVEQEQPKEEELVSKTPAELSPMLRAIHDEVGDFKVRSEALDAALASSEHLDEPNEPAPTSVFDVVKLSKKDKKKSKKAKGTVPDSETTTPAANLGTAVETKDLVEDPVVAGVPPTKMSKEKRTSIDESTDFPIKKDVSAVTEPVTLPESRMVSTKEDTIESTSASDHLDLSALLSETLEEDVQSSVFRKLSKKDKKKAKQATLDAVETVDSFAAAPALSRNEDPPADKVEAADNQDVQVNGPNIDDGFGSIAKKTKKQKRKSQAATATLEDLTPTLPTPSADDSIERSLHSDAISVDQSMKTIEGQSASAPNDHEKSDVRHVENVGDTIPQPSTLPDPTFKTPTEVLDAPHLPVLARKTSRQHKLAALFEQGATMESPVTQPELRREGTGSVKNLAEQFETHSRSRTPVSVPATERRTVSRGAAVDRHEESASPRRDIEFMGTVAAGLKMTGFDEDKYVVNNTAFHQSTSPDGTRDITPDDDVAAALDNASTSKFATRGWTTPTSSPKLRPTREADSDTLPPLEVAIAPTDLASFDPLDVLNDPTFSKRNTSPGILEEADPDELGAHLKMNKKSKGKKKRSSLPESPNEPTTVINEPTATESQLHKSTDSAALTDQPPHTPSEDQQLRVEDIPEDAFTNRSSKKSKKSKKEKKRGSIAQGSVENAAPETLVVEARTHEHPTVETLADSTIDQDTSTIILPETPAAAEREIAASDDPQQYPFPEVSRPRSAIYEDLQETTKAESGRQRGMDEELEPSSSRRKGRVGRKNKEGLEAGDITKGQEEEVARKRSHLDQDQPAHSTHEGEHDTHKRRSHPVSFEEDQPLEKRQHIQELIAQPTSATVLPATTLNAPTSSRGPSLAAEPSWSFAGVQDDTTKDTDSPVRTTTYESPRDKDYPGHGNGPAIQQDEAPNPETLRREKKRRSKEPKTPAHDTSRSAQELDESPSLPVFSSTTTATPSAPDYATKERTSYLFDSSPSTRGYGTSPAIGPVTPAHERSISSQSAPKANIGSADTSAGSHSGSRGERLLPSKEAEQKEPYQSIFGDPNETQAGASKSLTTPASKHGRTPSNKQLHTITEASPDDSPLHKKSRAITDVGSPERGVKSARRTDSPKPFAERLMSPPPVTPTPSTRRAGPIQPESTGRNSPSRDTPWHQVHDKVDRSMTLSPARRLPRSSPSFDPIKQHMAEQRSPSVASQRSMSNISKLRTPDQERPLSSASNRSTQSLRRVDRSASGDLRASARLGEDSAQDANSPTPNLSGTALAAGATAAIAGIAATSKYDPVRGAGKGRRASMAAETYVSV